MFLITMKEAHTLQEYGAPIQLVKQLFPLLRAEKAAPGYWGRCHVIRNFRVFELLAQFQG